MNTVATVVPIGTIRASRAERSAVFSSLLGVIEKAEHIRGARHELKRVAGACLAKGVLLRMGNALTVGVADFAVVTIGGIGIRAGGALGAVVSGLSIGAAATNTNVSQLTVPRIPTSWLASFGLGIAVLIEFAMDAASTAASEDALATGRIGGVANFAVRAIVIAKARGTRLASTPGIAVTAFTTSIIGFAEAGVVFAEFTHATIGICDAFVIGFVCYAANVAS